MNATKCTHESLMAALVDRFQQWRGYDCPYCEIQRLRDELTAMTLERDRLLKDIIFANESIKAMLSRAQEST